MAGHTFGARLHFLRHYVKRVARITLADEVNRVTGLVVISADQIREWELTGASLSPHVKALLCKVMGFAKNLLDPDNPDWRVSPQWFLRITRSRGWSQMEIAHNWRMLERGLSFHGEPNDLEFERILDTYGVRFMDYRQASFFWDEFWCTHCGHWQSTAAIVCPKCGNQE